MLRSSIRPLLLLAPFVGLALQATPKGPDRSTAPPPLGASLAALSAVGEAPAALIEAARAAADRESRATSVAEAIAAQQTVSALCAALARLEGAQTLNWDRWIDAELRNRDLLALTLYQASLRAHAPHALERAKRLSDRTTPVALRMEAHRALWELDHFLAAQLGRRLVMELPRGTTSMHARYAEVLAERPEQEALDLLIELAHRDGMESYARMSAIDAIVATARADLAADLASIWTASTGDLAVRKAALLGTLRLDLAFGKDVLRRAQIDETNQPVLFAFVQSLREQYGVTGD